MGEIKSTLDLVLERTKHLTLSEEDRNKQKKDDFQKHLKGIIQRFQDGVLNTDRFQQQFSGLEKTWEIEGKPLLLLEILDKAEPDQDNTLLLLLLREICGVNPANMKKIDADYQDILYKTAEKRSREMLRELEKKYKISGSAVVPNLDSDIEWSVISGKIKGNYILRFNEEKKRLISG